MRISEQALARTSLHRLNLRMTDMATAQQQLSSGKRIRRPSDDIASANRALTLHTQLRAGTQAKRNADDAQLWVNLADTKLQGVVSSIQRARELAIQGASSATTSFTAGLADEIAAIRDEVLATANTSHDGRRLFAGFSGGDAVTKVAGTWTYTGDTGSVQRRIGDGEMIQINVRANEVFGFGGRDLFSVLDDLEASLRNGDASGSDTAIAELDGALDAALAGLSQLGSAGRRIEAAQIRGDAEQVEVRGALSNVEDVDLAAAVLELQMSQAAYQAALSSVQSVMQLSLGSFLG
jgi:flagellar hook-associated protein 3 FlgL